MLAEGITFLPIEALRSHADNKLPEAASPRKDQPERFKNVLLSIVFVIIICYFFDNHL
ncbi:hypothetical protein HMPREF0645_1063 [Hallella bergensis DSM 17361]|uniref:Uncharacterized protein n=1 Tax=Hallella bergensis DSM 17361 TaxID=585502 RepID=D1PVS8_9BACT|nr:hypothetical protein HMPREF0645_1063 [Hallella bergensis DSM 17361]